MLDFDSLRLAHPNMAFVDGPPKVELEFSNFAEVLSCIAVDGNGDLLGQPSEDSISVRWKYTTVLRSISGFVTDVVRYDPPEHRPPITIGVLLTKAETIRAVNSDEAKQSIALSEATHFVLTAANCVIEYQTGLSLIDPKELGIDLELPQ